MLKLLDTLTSRRASIALMAFLAAVGAIGAWVPQRAGTSAAIFERWVRENPGLASIYASLGFDRIFSTWWFRSVMALFLLSLSVATWRMLRAAWRRTRRVPAPPRSPLPHADLEAVVRRARAAGFRERSSGDGVRVLWRHRLGIWGPAVMHTGMVVAMIAAIAASALTTRAVVDLSAGEIVGLDHEYLVVEGGILDTPPSLGTPFRLDRLTTEAWPNGELRTVIAHLSIMNGSRQWIAYESSPNHPLRFRGHTVYVQPGEFGDAAYLIVTDGSGAEARLRMEFTFVSRGTAAYSDNSLPDGTTLEARWDPFGLKGDKPLALRIAGQETTGPVLLGVGESAPVGGYTFDFVERGQWARLILVSPYGIGVLFAGFAVIGLGSLVTYAWIPRELVLAQENGEVRYAWRAARMARAYEAERDAILGLSTAIVDGEGDA